MKRYEVDILKSVDSQKEDNSGKMKPIAKVTMKMHHPVREDLLRYLQSNITKLPDKIQRLDLQRFTVW